MRAGCMRPWRGQCTGAGLMPGNGREGPMVDLACPPKACIQRKEGRIRPKGRKGQEWPKKGLDSKGQ